ncbi:hypothetical protein GV794_02025 [Nocardia cyriacigeorgica]|uniref:Transcriptional regulator n=1 Tax=Nocardia cyriacigeorgica TaxID=135487 RepID=A0ABX0CEH2_9NOCA|nr:hypothetical protein [Nocardia cyriacigeorgica]NEW42738.1 hypothetical protein [Nocardia cyriacigeorgica]NEW53967.1 hypothetical protein [Nocardia cyriacigeorgica]NEW54444.1 hypothetical protein [Nocardia cyriacigeorgica]
MIQYMSSDDFAKAHGLDAGTIRRYKHDGRLPEPDAVIGTGKDKRQHHGWLPETVKNWQRPGQGTRTDIRNRKA